MKRSWTAPLLAISLWATLAATAGAQSLAPAGAWPPPLDPLPHELHPQSWPQPDYFTEALRLTRFQGGERWRALKLAAGHEPDVLVMPVQMQAFGWTPAFAAILGARLDHELDERRVDANRQTDLFDADGPYARRFTEAETDRFARAHTAARLLALYIGRDGAGKDFVTLTLRRNGQVLRAHRTFAETPKVADALDAFSANFPALLDELGLAPSRQPQPAQRQRACESTDWALADLALQATRADRACRAIAIGTLLPEFDSATSHYPRIKTGDKLAWLAEGWVEASALAPESATAVRAVAWSQLELTPSYEMVSTAADAADPVARALARALWASQRTRAMPITNREAGAQAYAEAAAASLPAFMRATLIERAMIPESFRRVDLCSLEMALPALRTPAGCSARGASSRKQPPTRGERALLDAWRIAHAFKDLNVDGTQRGVREARQADLDALPARIAAHPIIRMERFSSEEFEAATGSFDALLGRALVATTDFAQSTADVQRWSAELVNQAISYERWTTNAALLTAPAITAVSVDEMRMLKVLSIDGFTSRDYALPMRAQDAYMNLLSPGPLEDLRQRPRVMPSGRPDLAVTPRRVIQLDLFTANMGFPGERSPAETAQAVAADPRDLEALTDLALLRVKQGQDIAQARALIDARPVDRRDDAAIGESHAWVTPASAFWYAGEFEAATSYYKRVVGFGSYSSSDLQARVRLRLAAGDLPGALKASSERLQRYGDDFSRRDTAGLDFMAGHPAQAWAVLDPRLPVSDQPELWMGVQVGQRIEGKSVRAAADWIEKSGFGHALVGDIDIRDLYLVRFMTDDRTPSADDLALLAERRLQRPPAHQGGVADMQAMALLKQLSTAPTVTPDDLRAVRALLAPQGSSWRTRGAMAALYAWNAWRASGGKDPVLALFRDTVLTKDLDALLARAVVVGLDGRTDDALKTLRAARYDLGFTTGERRRDSRSATYTAAYVAWLLYGQTHDTRYRNEALLLARANQRITPYLAWPHALEALLAPSGPARTTAACRAAFLDRGSLFLSLSGLQPDVKGARCRMTLW